MSDPHLEAEERSRRLLDELEAQGVPLRHYYPRPIGLFQFEGSGMEIRIRPESFEDINARMRPGPMHQARLGFRPKEICPEED